MLITKQFETGRHIWSPNKLCSFNESSASPRMSNLESLSSQPDWRDNYHLYLSQGTAATLSPRFYQQFDTTDSSISISQRNTAPRPVLEHRHSLAQLHKKQDTTDQAIERPGSAPPRNVGESTTENDRQSLISNDLASNCHIHDPSKINTTMSNSSTSVQIKSEASQLNEPMDSDLRDDDVEDVDDDMYDAEENLGNSQTESARRADRRKMKRFRLTHQQTRFLQQEFGRQAHPDAAHRERLSKEIPGLSPRQVQVWFQNRRAKIKRVHVDQRDQVIKSRSVPDGFDSVQALHATYGALHAVGTPMMSPVEYQSGFGDPHMIRPLMVDTMRRQEMDEHMSPNGMSPGFGQVGFANNAPTESPDVLSPISLNSSDRYYPSHLASPLSGPRSSNPFLRQNSSDNYQIHSQQRQQSRPLQPLQLREAMSRSRSESLQSPLRSSMSWKGETLDYANYPGETNSPTLTGRQQSLYQSDQNSGLSMNSQSYGLNGYTTTVPTTYPSSQPAVSSSIPSLSRFRASSSAYPPNLDLRNHYNNLSSQPTSAPAPLNPNHPSTPRNSSFGSPFTATTVAYASAPLQAPSDFGLPRTPVSLDQGQMGQTLDSRARDFHLGQMSAPMAPPPDFNYQNHQPVSLLSPARHSLHNTRTERGLRRDESDFTPHSTTSSLATMVEQTQQNNGRDTRAVRDEYSDDQDVEAPRRKRKYSMGSYHHPS